MTKTEKRLYTETAPIALVFIFVYVLLPSTWA